MVGWMMHWAWVAVTRVFWSALIGTGLLVAWRGHKETV